MSRLLLLLTIFGIADSFVEFTHSILYDQYDIFQPTTTMFTDLCKPGCSIYASIPPGSAALKEAQNVTISDGQTEKTILEIAGLIDENSSQKLSFDVPARQQTLLIRYTGKEQGGPVLLYVFSTTGRSGIPFEVYEARTMKRPLSPARIVTILSPEPYNVGTDATQLGNTVYSYSAGMDNAIEYGGADGCVKVFELRDQGSFPGFVLNVQLPLLSFYFNMDTPVQFYTMMEYSTVTGFGQFLSSPGFVGCFGMQVYRSSLYPDSLDHTVSGEKKEHLRVDATLNVDEDSPVLLTDVTNDTPHPLWGDNDHGNAQQNLTMDSKLLLINWRKKLTRSAFLLRFTTSSEENPTSTTTTTISSPTTSDVERCTFEMSLLLAILWMF